MERRTIGLFAGALLVFGAGTTAFAGAHHGGAVVVMDESRFAHGDAGPVLDIPSGNVAAALAELSRRCPTADPAHRAAIHLVDGDPHRFRGWSIAGHRAITNAEDSPSTDTRS